MKLKGEQEEIWNNSFQAKEDPYSLRARTSSGSSSGQKSSSKNVDIEEAGDVLAEEQGDVAIELVQKYQQEEVGVRSREKSFESKNRLQSPTKLSSTQRKLSTEITHAPATQSEVEIEMASLEKKIEQEENKGTEIPE